MIQQKSPDKKKTLISIVLIVVMIGGTIVLLISSSGSKTSPLLDGIQTIPPSGAPASSGSSGVRFEKNIFEQKEFLTLIQQSSLPDVPQEAKGRPNPFVPLFEVQQKN